MFLSTAFAETSSQMTGMPCRVEKVAAPGGEQHLHLAAWHGECGIGGCVVTSYPTTPPYLISMVGQTIDEM